MTWAMNWNPRRVYIVEVKFGHADDGKRVVYEETSNDISVSFPWCNEVLKGYGRVVEGCIE
jgi:hypothetical protein